MLASFIFIVTSGIVNYLSLFQLFMIESIHFHVRLTPVYAIVMGFIATLMVYIGTGPNWYNVLVASQSCRVAWWKQLLFSNQLTTY